MIGNQHDVETQEDRMQVCGILRDMTTKMTTEYFSFQKSRDSVIEYKHVFSKDISNLFDSIFTTTLDHLDADIQMLEHVVKQECEGVPYNEVYMDGKA